jgi:hypothetical protein
VLYRHLFPTGARKLVILEPTAIAGKLAHLSFSRDFVQVGGVYRFYGFYIGVFFPDVNM